MLLGMGTPLNDVGLDSYMFQAKFLGSAKNGAGAGVGVGAGVEGGSCSAPFLQFSWVAARA